MGGGGVNLTYSLQTKKKIDPLKYYVKIDDEFKNRGKTIFFSLIQLQITCWIVDLPILQDKLEFLKEFQTKKLLICCESLLIVNSLLLVESKIRSESGL